jgi:hypothetical protein
MGERTNAHRTLADKLLGKRLLERLRRKWWDHTSTKMDLAETDSENELPRDRVQWQGALATAGMNLSGFCYETAGVK